MITILCSSVTLGVYVPALLLQRDLKKKGISSEVIAYENLLIESKRNNIDEVKIAYHRNFKFAKMGQKLSQANNNHNLDDHLVQGMLSRWEKEKRSHFIVFSGFWITVLNKYQTHLLPLFPLNVDCVYMDAIPATSWQNQSFEGLHVREIKLFDEESSQVNTFFQVNEGKYKEYENRNNTLLLHGGGWGIGTYQEKVLELADKGFSLHVIAYEEADYTIEDPRITYHLIDPSYKAYQVIDGNYIFPPLGEVKSGQAIEFVKNDSYPPIYDLIMNCKAIISKPGGGTLNDSFSSGTPLIYLEPYGEYERSNAALWKRLGLGISYDDWKKMDYSFSSLEEIHENLKNYTMKTKTVDNRYYETRELSSFR